MAAVATILAVRRRACGSSCTNRCYSLENAQMIERRVCAYCDCSRQDLLKRDGEFRHDQVPIGRQESASRAIGYSRIGGVVEAESMLEGQRGRGVMVGRGELNRVTANVFEQTESRTHLDRLETGMPRKYVAHLVKSQAGGAHREASDHRSGKVPVGLAVYRQEPLQDNTCVDEPAVDGEERCAHPSRSRSACTSAAASTGPSHRRERPSSSHRSASRSRRSSPSSRRAPFCKIALRLVLS